MIRFTRAAGLVALALFATASVPADVVLVFGDDGAYGFRADTTAWLPNSFIGADEVYLAGLDFAPSGDLVAVEYYDSDIHAFSGEDGAYIGILDSFPEDIIDSHVGPDDTLYGVDDSGGLYAYDFALGTFTQLHSFGTSVEAIAQHGDLIYALTSEIPEVHGNQISTWNSVTLVESSFFALPSPEFVGMGFELEVDANGATFIAPEIEDILTGQTTNWIIGTDAAGVEMWRTPTVFNYVDGLELASDGSLWVAGSVQDEIVGEDIHVIERYDTVAGFPLGVVRSGADPAYPSVLLSGPGGYGPEPAAGAGAWPGFTLPPAPGTSGVPNDVVLVASAFDAYIEGFQLSGSVWPTSPFITDYFNGLIMNPTVRDMEWDLNGNLLVLFNGPGGGFEDFGGEFDNFGGGSEVARFDGTTGAFIESVAILDPFDPFEQIHTAVGLEVGDDGVIYVGMDKRGVYKIDPDGPPFPMFEFHFATGDDSLPAYWGADMTDFQVHGTDAYGIFASTGAPLVVDRTPLAQDGPGTRYTEADVSSAVDSRHNTLAVADDGSMLITYRDTVLGEEVLRSVSAAGVAGAKIPLGTSITTALASEFVNDDQTQLWLTAGFGELGSVVLNVDTTAPSASVQLTSSQFDGPMVQALLRGNQVADVDDPIIDNCPQNDQKLEPEICGCWYYDIPVPEELDGGTACQHITATVDNETVDLLDMVYVEAYADVESNTFVDKRSIVYEYAHVGERTTIGHDTLLLRRSDVGDDVQIGDDSIIGRLAEIGDNSVLLDSIVVGYSSHLGPLTTAADFTVVGAHVEAPLGGVVMGGGLGNPVVIGSRAELAPGTTLGQGTVVGPQTVFTGVTTVGTNARIRKQATIVGPSTIEANARVGRGVQLLGTNIIGDNARIGAEAVVPALECVAADAQVRRGEHVEVGQFTCPAGR